MTTEAVEQRVGPTQVPSDAELTAAIRGRSPSKFDEAMPSSRQSRQITYWKLHTCDNDCSRHLKRKGWVTTGPVMSPLTASEWAEFRIIHHALPLDEQNPNKYGKFEDGPIFAGLGRFEPLLEQGGIVFFPKEQLIQYGWAKIDAVKKARPDLGDFKYITCDYDCGVKPFHNKDGYNRHLTAYHRDASSAQAVGQQVQSAMSQILTAMPANQSINVNELSKAIVAAVMQAQNEVSED